LRFPRFHSPDLKRALIAAHLWLRAPLKRALSDAYVPLQVLGKAWLSTYTKEALDPSKLLMRPTLFGLCILAMLFSAQANAAPSSSAHKRVGTARSNAQTTLGSAHIKDHRSSSRTIAAHTVAAHTVADRSFSDRPMAVRHRSADRLDSSRRVAERRVTNRSVSDQRISALSAGRGAARGSVAGNSSRSAKAQSVLASGKKGHKPGYARLERIRLVNQRSHSRQAIETEMPGRNTFIEPPALRHMRALVIMPMPLRGSRESLIRQNERSEVDGLERIEDDEDLNDRIASKALVLVPLSAAVAINSNLPQNRRYCRPWTASFLKDLGQAHAAAFNSSLTVTSAVRTVAFQKQLRGVNGNAAAAEGDVASPHLTGGSIDIGKQKLSRQEIAWLRNWLLPLQQAGKIDVEEEFKQACFHITVYKSYVPDRQRRVQRQIQPNKPYIDAGQIASAGQ